MADGEDMITAALKVQNWMPMNKQTQLVGRGIGAPVVEFGNGYWEIEFTYQNMEDDEWLELQAWLARRKGAASYFSAWRAMNPNTRGGATSCTIAEQGTDELRVTSSPALQVGDMVAYDAATEGRFVGIVTEITTTGAGYVDVRTFPDRVSVHGTPNAACQQAKGYFRLQPDSVRLEDPFDKKKSMSFKAVQLEAY